MEKIEVISIATSGATIQTRESILFSGAGAFFGALFAFLFGLVAFYFQKKFERYWKHKNAVVEIEHLLNDHLNTSAGNQYLLQGAIDTLQRNHMTYTLLTPFRLPEDISLRIGNLEVLNRYADYKEPNEKVSHGILAWQGLNEQLHQSVISNPNLPPPIVHKNMEHIQKQAESLMKFLKGLDEDMKIFLAYIRVYLRKDKHIWSVRILKIKNQPVVAEDEIASELKEFNKEVEENIRKSRERIAKIMEG